MEGRPQCRLCMLGVPGGMAAGEVGTGCGGPPALCTEGAPGETAEAEAGEAGRLALQELGVGRRRPCPGGAGSTRPQLSGARGVLGAFFTLSRWLGVPRCAPRWALVGETPGNGAGWGRGAHCGGRPARRRRPCPVGLRWLGNGKRGAGWPRSQGCSGSFPRCSVEL